MNAFLDLCVLLDVFSEDPVWFEWAAGVLADVLDDGIGIINPVVLAVVSVGFERIEALREALHPHVLESRPIPSEAAFLAGKCFLKYRRRGGRKRSPLPDFFIGAHAAVLGLPLVTRDARRYRTYFPRLKLICPG